MAKLKQGQRTQNYYPLCAKSSLAQSLWHEAVGIARRYLAAKDNIDGVPAQNLLYALQGAAVIIQAREEFYNKEPRTVKALMQDIIRDCRTVDMYPEEYDGVGEGVRGWIL